MSSNVEIKWNEKAIANLMAASKSKAFVKIGVLSSAQHDSKSKLSIAGLAAVHEFGSMTRNIPSRSFFRKTLAHKKEEFIFSIANKGQQILTYILNGKLDTTVLGKVGAMWVKFIQNCFDSRGFGEWAALKNPSSKRRGTVLKGRKNRAPFPLMDTKVLYRAITFMVKK